MASDIPDKNNIVQCSTTSWKSLPEDVKDLVVAHLPMHKVFQFQSTCKEYGNIIARKTFLQPRLTHGLFPSEGKFGPMYFFIDPATRMWQWVGFDVLSNRWHRLPSLSFLATPNQDLFKEFLIAGSGGLLCVNVSKNPFAELLIVCNPVTRAMRELPPMHFPRQPVLMNLVLDDGATGNYKVIVAGSATIGTEALSRKTEVYDSTTRMWEVTGDVPGPEYALNEYQTGVVSKNFLFCVGFFAPENNTTTITRGVLAYDIVKKAWIQHNDEEQRWRQQQWALPSLECCHRPASPNYSTQIFECEGSIFVYWEQEHNRTMVHFCVAKLELSAVFSTNSSVRAAAAHDHPGSLWSMVVHDDKVGSRGLLVYPEHVCVGHGASKVCLFNSVDLTSSMTYKIGPGGPGSKPMPLPKPPPLPGKATHGNELSASEREKMPDGMLGSNDHGNDNNNNVGKPLFFSLNPLSFSFEPSFHTMV